MTRGEEKNLPPKIFIGDPFEATETVCLPIAIDRYAIIGQTLVCLSLSTSL